MKFTMFIDNFHLRFVDRSFNLDYYKASSIDLLIHKVCIEFSCCHSLISLQPELQVLSNHFSMGLDGLWIYSLSQALLQVPNLSTCLSSSIECPITSQLRSLSCFSRSCWYFCYDQVKISQENHLNTSSVKSFNWKDIIVLFKLWSFIQLLILSKLIKKPSDQSYKKISPS